jgi:hypothetical protein
MIPKTFYLKLVSKYMRPWRTLHIRQFIFNKSTGNKKIVFTLAYVSDSGLSVYLNRITLNLAQSEWINKLTYCFFLFIYWYNFLQNISVFLSFMIDSIWKKNKVQWNKKNKVQWNRKVYILGDSLVQTQACVSYSYEKYKE